MIEEMKIRYNCENICDTNKPSEKNYKNNKCSCIYIVIAILSALFIGIIGVIIGAALSTTIISALAAVIVLAIALFISIILSIIVALCCKSKKQKCCHNKY